MEQYLFSVYEADNLPKPGQVEINALVMMLRSADREQVKKIAQVLKTADDPNVGFLTAVVNKAMGHAP